MTRPVEFGLLVPHFTQHASRDRLIEGARLADGFGFDSLWVRDHLFISPAHQEHGGIRDPGFILEAMLVLAALSTITTHVRLGTAVVTPHRHPLKLAQLVGTLDYLSGGRSILGIGLGWDVHEFAALGLAFDERIQMVRESVEVCRLAWREPTFRYRGRVYDIPAASVNPRPARRAVPVWYGGLSYKAVELAVEFGDGWLPSRIPFDRLAPRVARAKALLGSPARVGAFTFAAMPQTALGASAAAALARFDLARVKAEALHRKPVSGGRADLSLRDLEGYLIWGTGADICRSVERFLAIDVTHIVFDLRASFGDFLEHVRVLGTEVLPRFR